MIFDAVVGNTYTHKPEETFTLNGQLYVFDEKNTQNILSLQTVSGHPDIDELDVYYTVKENSKNLIVSRVTLNKPVKLSGKKVKLKWKKVSGAKGYQVVYATNSKFKKATKKTTAKTALTIKTLKKGKIYYVKVRAYKLNSAGAKVYGTYSTVRKVTVK